MTLTDLESALPWLARNIARNGLGHVVRGQELRWGAKNVPAQLQRDAQVVLCSDLVYAANDTGVTSALCDTIAQFAGAACVISAVEQRTEASLAQLELFEAAIARVGYSCLERFLIINAASGENRTPVFERRTPQDWERDAQAEEFSPSVDTISLSIYQS